MGWLLTGVFCLLPGVALAHNLLISDGQDQLAGWLTASLLAGFWLLYGAGARRVKAEPWRQWLFHGTALLSVVTLLGPLDDWAKTSTAVHMLQHMLLIVVIAPFWVICRPLPALAAITGQKAAVIWNPLLRLTRHPLVCAYIHGIAIWFWHTPDFYMLAVNNPWWHALEHACFLMSAGLFWWAVLRSPPQRLPWALLALLFTLMHTGFLGAILTFSAAPLYGEARSLQDQQLSGLIMWVLGAIPYLLAAAWAGHRWYGHLVRRLA